MSIQSESKKCDQSNHNQNNYFFHEILMHGIFWNIVLKGVLAKNERGYRLNAIKKRF